MSVEQTRAARSGGAGRRAGRQRGTLSRRAYLRHHRREEAETGGRGADVPWLAHAHARHQPERQGEPTSTDGTATVRAPRAAAIRCRTGDDPTSSASTSSRFPSPPLRKPASSAARGSLPTRRRAQSRVWPGGDHGPARRRRRSPISAMTLRLSRGRLLPAPLRNGILLDIWIR